jgi:hypothetical protein
MSLKLNTASGGSITLQEADTASNLTLTVPAQTSTILTKDSTSGMAVPAFNVGGSSTQSVSAGVITKMQLNTEVFDTNNCFDSTTNYRFTPNVAGYYQINGLLSSATSTSYMSVWIYKNGANVAVTFSNNEFGLCASTSVVVYCNGTTDYIELYGALSGSGTIYSPDTRMSGVLVRAA